MEGGDIEDGIGRGEGGGTGTGVITALIFKCRKYVGQSVDDHRCNFPFEAPPTILLYCTFRYLAAKRKH